MGQNITWLGNSYSDVPFIELPKTGGGQALFTDTAPTTAIAEDVASGKIFFDSTGAQITGTGQSANLQPIIMRPDAELVATYAFDEYAVSDMGLTIPAYTTTTQTLKASVSLTPTYSLDLANYSYYVIERMLTIPQYSIETKAKGRCEYTFAATGYEIAVIEANEMHSLIEPTRKVTSRAISVYNTGNFARIVYYSAATTINAYASAAYAVYQTVAAPVLSGSTLTLKSPVFCIRGHATYFTNTFMNACTDIRYQYVIEVWRAPKGNLSFDGWTCHGNAMQILDCIDATDHKLT